MPKQILVKAEEIKQVISLAPGRQLTLTRPLVMGILNVTPDSFSDGGKYTSTDKAVKRALEMETEGADIIDIGGESSRPGSEPVSEKQELERLIPVMKILKKHLKIPISVDTYKANVAKASLEEGAEIINDISALRFDQQMAPLAAEKKVPVILMHMLGTPRDMQKNPSYRDCVAEISLFFTERVAFAVKMGIDKSKIILDPGIGFGKRLVDNIEIIANFKEFKKLSRPLMVGVSRKSFIGMLNPDGSFPDRRLGGSIAAAVAAVLNGADIIRVHDVAETVEALKVIQAVKE
ncbi:MAG: dihydropteroate synthase [candidate division Zixibacteria bacterium]|nr:dihydropteroate synthase [candidate division Zixibacteria bacterium]MDD5425570.1 dihydropteroate synthase [candidate division Zixibacteria bacterium]